MLKRPRFQDGILGMSSGQQRRRHASNRRVGRLVASPPKASSMLPHPAGRLQLHRDRKLEPPPRFLRNFKGASLDNLQ